MNEKDVKRTRRKRAPKGDGWIYPRGNVWIAAMKYRRPATPDDPDPKTKLIRESTGFFVDRDEKSEAQEFLRQWTTKIRAGKLVAPAGPPPARLRDLRDEMLRDVRKNGRKYEARVMQCFKHLEAHFGEKRAAATIDGDAIAEYIEARMDKEKAKLAKKKPASVGTANRELSALRRAFKLYRRKESSKKEKRLTASPEIILMAEDNVRERCPSDEELEKVIAELPDRLKAPIRFAAYSGWRVGNVLGLLWRHVDEDKSRIRIPARETKGGKRAKKKQALELPYDADPELAEIIRERREATDRWRRERADFGPVEHVFWFVGIDEHGHAAAVPNREYRRAWERACERAKVEDLHVHDLRRYYASRAVRAGVDEVTIMRLCGWSTRSMFDRYSIRNEEDLVAGVKKLAHARSAAVARTQAARAKKA